ncbi:MAG: hypothetical protein IRY99_04130 [Isosphaeraceae bacterium]|nr:hypothetical protein [Isosphaeraceae bacterium]
MDRNIGTRWLAAITPALFLFLWGCGGTDPAKPPLGKVSGKVTYKGKPVTNGSVIFTPVAGKGAETGQVATGQLESDGSFVLTTFDIGDGAVLGQHTVTVEARSEDINKLNQPKEDGTIAYILPKPSVPEKYTKPATSPLRYTVEAGSNHFDIELKD